MTVAIGTRLGPYQILAEIGAGGMGEVYRARDTRLDRIVAIKVLSSSLSVTPELKARFEREARAISALNHAHICHLYDAGSENGTEFLVIEFLEGESLSDRLRRGLLGPRSGPCPSNFPRSSTASPIHVVIRAAAPTWDRPSPRVAPE